MYTRVQIFFLFPIVLDADHVIMLLLQTSPSVFEAVYCAFPHGGRRDVVV